MKKLTLISAFALTLPSLFAQESKLLAETQTVDDRAVMPETADAAAQQNVPESYKKAINGFSNLPEAQRLDFLKKRQEASVLFRNKRVIETIELTRQLSEIFDADPQVMNLRGACYVELRDFAKATEQFEKSMEITGPSLNVLFNIGEVAFVSENWQGALDAFTKALELAPEKASDMKQIIEFKLMLSHLALSTSEELSESDKAGHAAKVTEYAKLYNFLDDSPYYYYANAALAFSKDDKEEGQRFLGKASRVYANNPAALASWVDTMTEFGYIESFYGDKAEGSEDK